MAGRIYLANVGANASHRFAGPIFADGTFEFLPIPEDRDLPGDHAVRYRDLKAHNEPGADLLRYVLDDDVAEISAVSDATPEKPLEELVTLALRFKSGALATVLTGRRTPDYERNDVTVYGTLGRAGLQASVDMNQAGVLAVRTDALTEDEAYAAHPFALYTRQVEAFDGAVEGNGAPLATGVDGLRVVEITLAMVESARTGARVALG